MLLSNLRFLRRRWYVVLAGLLATAGLCWSASMIAPVTYETTASLLVLPPPATTQDGRLVNPYLRLGGLEGVADVLTTAMTDDTTADALAASASDVEYTVDRDRATAGPIILINVVAPSASTALTAQTFLLDRAPQTLASLQTKSGVTEGQHVRATTITFDERPGANYKGLVRALIVAGGGGLALTLLAAALAEGILGSRMTMSRLVPARSAAAGPGRDDTSPQMGRPSETTTSEVASPTRRVPDTSVLSLAMLSRAARVRSGERAPASGDVDEAWESTTASPD